MNVRWLLFGCWLATSCLRYVDNLPPDVTPNPEQLPPVKYAAINTALGHSGLLGRDAAKQPTRKDRYLRVLLKVGLDPYLVSYLEYQEMKDPALLLKVDELYDVPNRCDWTPFLYALIPCSLETEYEVRYAAYRGPELVHSKSYTPKEELNYWLFYLPVFWLNFDQPNTEEIDRRMLVDFLSELTQIQRGDPPKTEPPGPGSGS